MNTTIINAPASVSAWMPQTHPGIARVCAYHNQLVPRSKEAAEAFALFHRLEVSHGICPACAIRQQKEIAEARRQRLARIREMNTERSSPVTYAMQRSGII